NHNGIASRRVDKSSPRMPENSEVAALRAIIFRALIIEQPSLFIRSDADDCAPFKGEIGGRGRGVMVSMESRVSTAYALNNIQERGRLFIGPQEDVYVGMIVGENARPEDLPVNPCKAKHLTNMRSQGEGKGIQLEAPLRMTLERAIEYIDIDEYVEATPKSLRLRKRILDVTAR